MHECNQHQKIDAMEAKLKNIDLVLTGEHGNPGIISEMIMLNQNVVNTSDAVTKLTEEVENLIAYRIAREAKREEHDRYEREEHSKKERRREVRQYVVTSIIAVSAILSTFIIAIYFTK